MLNNHLSWTTNQSKNNAQPLSGYIQMSTFSSLGDIVLPELMILPKEFHLVFEGNLWPSKMKYIYILKHKVKVK